MPKKKYAGFWPRFVAAIIDGIFVVVVPYTIGWFINIYLVGQYGYSIGKRILGLRVTKENGKYPIGLVDALVREVIGKFVSAIILGIGFLMIAFDDKKQGLHDKIAKTVVIYGK